MPFGKPKPDVPLWKRRKQAAGQKVTVVVPPRTARRLARDPAYIAAITAAPGAPGRLPAARELNHVLASTGLWRFRLHLIPLAWTLALGAAGWATNHAARPLPAGVITGLAGGALIWACTRARSPFAARMATALAGLTAVWTPVLAATGFTRPWPGLLALTWAAVAYQQSRHYRIRGDPPPPAVDVSDVATWDRLAAERKWAGQLGPREDIATGGRRYPIFLDGTKTHIHRVTAEPMAIAAAWDSAITEAYVEPSPDGVASRGWLVLLEDNGLSEVREWDGTGIDLRTGMARVARFADGQPVRVQWFAPMDGVYHEILGGVTGSGKTTVLELGLCIAAVSGIVHPFILDPQEGQSLPEWRGHVTTAEGAEACLLRVRGLHAGMLAQSRYLAGRQWRDPDGDLHKGMGFFDPALAGVPIAEVIIDEAPALLTSADKETAKAAAQAAWLVGDMTKRGRKAGVRMKLAVGVPSLAEIGGQRAMRSYLRGCNVGMLRVDDPGDAGFLGIAADPSQIPPFFRDGTRTQGLGYWKGPDNRPGTPTRADLPVKPGKVAAAAVWPELGEAFAEAMEAKMRADDPLPEPLPAPRAASALRSVPPPQEDDEPALPGRTAADAIRVALAEAGGDWISRGKLLQDCARIAIGRWGRSRPFHIRTITTALAKEVDAKRVEKTGDGLYRQPRLHVVEDGADNDGTQGGSQ